MRTGRDRDGVRGVHADLDMAFAHIEQLRELAADTQKAPDNDRIYDFSIRWGVLLSGRLRRLSYYYRSNDLDADQVMRYQGVCAELLDTGPLANALGLPRAEIAAEDFEPGTAAPAKG